MRVTVNRLDPDYTTLHKYVDFVTLDGEKVPHCISADEEKGEVVIYKTDKDGKPIVSGEYYQAERLTGKVEIHFSLFQIIPSSAFLKPCERKLN